MPAPDGIPLKKEPAHDGNRECETANVPIVSPVPLLLLLLCTSRRRSPGDAVILAVVARGTPHRAMSVVEPDGRDRTGRALRELQRVAHALQLRAHCLRR